MKDKKEKLEKIKNELKEFGKSVVHNIPNILIALFIMITAIALFGQEKAVLGILLLFFQLMCMSTSFSVTKFIKGSLILLIVGLFAGLAQLNTPLLILLNFLVPFGIIMLLSDDYNSNGYFVYGLFFLLMQTSNVQSIPDLGIEVLSIVYGLLVLFIYNLIMSKINKKEPEKKLIATGYESVVKRLKILSKQKLDEKTPNPLNNIVAKINALLYSEASQKTEVLNKKEECYFQSVLFLKRVDKLTNLALENKEKLTEEDYKYFYDIARLFQTVKEQYSMHDINDIIKMLDEFAESHKLSDSSMTYDWVYTIKKLKHIIKMANKPKPKISFKEYLNIRATKLKNNFSLDTIQMRFALKTALAVGIGTILEYFVMIKTGFANAYWIPITVYTLMMQFHEEQNTKIKNYIIGTLLGAVVFTLVFQFVPPSAGLFFMVLAFAVMFSVKNEILRNVVGAQMVLVLTYPIYGKVEIILIRVGLIILASIITWIVGKHVLYTDNLNGLINKVSHLLRVDRNILKQLKKAINTKNSEFKYISELLLESCLLESLIIKHEKEQKYYSDPYLTSSVVQYNRDFILSAEQLINIFKTEDKEEIKGSKEYIKYIEEMDSILDVTQNNWKNILSDSKKTKKLEKKTIRKISDDVPYTTKHMMLCVKNIEKIYNCLEEDKIKIKQQKEKV